MKNAGRKNYTTDIMITRGVLVTGMKKISNKINIPRPLFSPRGVYIYSKYRSGRAPGVTLPQITDHPRKT